MNSAEIEHKLQEMERRLRVAVGEIDEPEAPWAESIPEQDYRPSATYIDWQDQFDKALEGLRGAVAGYVGAINSVPKRFRGEPMLLLETRLVKSLIEFMQAEVTSDEPKTTETQQEETPPTEETSESELASDFNPDFDFSNG